MKHRKEGIWILASLVCYFVSSASVFLLPWSTGEDGSLTSAGYIVGTLFWGGILAGILCWLLAYLQCKKRESYQKIKVSQRVGMISFFRNRKAAVADIGLIVGLILTIVGNFVWVQYLVGMTGLFLFLFCFHLHYVFNGRVYRYVFSRRD